MLGVSLGEALKQNFLGEIQKVNLTTCSQSRCTRAKIFPLTFAPEPKIENYVDSESQDSGGDLPLYGFDQVVPRIMFGLVNIHA